MLQLVTGRSGSGKTEYVRGVLGAMAKEGEHRLILIVPEQYSYDSERAMLKSFGNKVAQRVEVLSFTRLADFVFRNTGGNAGVVADDGTRLILMLRAMDAVADKLDYYAKYRDDVRLAKELIAIFREVRQSGADLSKLSKVSETVESPILSRKLKELFLIYDVYDAMFRQRYADDDIRLEKLCKVLDDTHFLSGYTFAIDGFKSFTGQEFSLLGRIFSQAKDVYVTLCTDGKNPSMVFHSVEETKRCLIRMANEQSIRVRTVPKEEAGLENGQRYLSPELVFLEQNLFYPTGHSYGAPSDHITICESQNQFEECEWIAATIRKLLREDGLRARDIAVIVRHEEDYQKELFHAFRRYEIPFFDDARQPVENQPLAVLCRTVLTLLANGFTSENLLQYLKTGLTDLTPVEIDELENYVFLWDIKGSDWQEAFSWSPFGLDASFRTEAEAEEALGLLNETRDRTIRPLQRLRHSVRDKSYREVGEELYRFLVRTNVAKHLKTYATHLNNTGLTSLAAEQDRIWDAVISIIDRLSAVYGEERCTSIQQYADLFYTLLSMTDLGNIPQGLDAVTVAAADRVRLSSPNTVFVAGLEEGVFPAVVDQSGLFTLHERALLREQGLELSFPEELRASEERFITYSAVTAPRERLYLSWHRLDASGDSYLPSELINGVRKLFTTDDELETPLYQPVDAGTLPADYYAETRASAYKSYAEHIRSEEQTSVVSIREALSAADTDGTYRNKLTSLDRALAPHEFQIQDPSISTELFRKDMSLSASRVDSYFHCAFQYFCRYGLNTEPRRRATLGANNYGTIIHYVLEQLLKESDKPTFVALTREQLHGRVDHWLSVFANTQLGGLDDKTPRFQYLYRRLSLTLYDIAERLQEELKVSDFVPTDFELSIGKDAEVESYKLDLPDGGSLSIRGSVDRVDLCEKDGKTYIRVVDYKSGGKAFELSDILYGLNLQMLLYLFTIEQNGTGKYENSVPAGILYYPAKRATGTTPRRDSPKEEASIDNSGKNAQNGLLLGEKDILEAMEHGLEGNFIPIRKKKAKDGSSTLGPADMLASLQELGQLHQRIDYLLTKMATDLHCGEIPAMPAEKPNTSLPCIYCDYRVVCRSEEPTTRVIEPIKDREALMEALAKEVDNDGKTNDLDGRPAESH